MSELKMLSLQAVEVEVVSAEELQLPLCYGVEERDELLGLAGAGIPYCSVVALRPNTSR
ncbi:hypothetical protein [Mycobacterium leprae]|uniref:hypothetical protein n=1 Tax=Mycobacterium leprae TaxID=1769 RepID=UPI0018D4A706